MTMTLEQQRAADAWLCAQGRSSEYSKLAKGLPALIMNSGLLQTLAFLEEKGQPHGTLGSQLRNWLSKRFDKCLPSAEFVPFMEALIDSDPQSFQEITTEAMAWLRWVRQVAPALEKAASAQAQ